MERKLEITFQKHVGEKLAGAPDAWTVALSGAITSPATAIVTHRLSEYRVLLPVPPETLAADMEAWYTALRTGYVDSGGELQPDMVLPIPAFGKALFDAVFAGYMTEFATLLAAIRADDPLEIAITYTAENGELASLPWELLHNATGFLTQREGVAITRRIVAPEPRSLTFADGCPRLLLVVGSAPNDEKLRPAAEYLALLRCFQNSGLKGVVSVHLLTEATTDLLRAAVQRFRPHIVHFVCHGAFDGSTPYLQLTPMDAETGAETASNNDGRVTAGQLLPLLRVKDILPLVVVLNACHTAEAMGDTEAWASGRAVSEPFGYQLVVGGVPLVVGMSGAVTDRACRLFTREFYTSLLSVPDNAPVDKDGFVQYSGTPVEQATAAGRRDGIVSSGLTDPRRSFDWAMPTLFLSHDLVNTQAKFRFPKWVIDFYNATSLYRRQTRPVFCGRYDLFRLLDALLMDPTAQSRFDIRKRAVLTPGADTGGTPTPFFQYLAIRYQQMHQQIATKPVYFQSGASRLLEELSARAVTLGHIPVLVNDYRWSETPITEHQWAGVICDAAYATALHLRFEDFQYPNVEGVPRSALSRHVSNYLKSLHTKVQELRGMSAPPYPTYLLLVLDNVTRMGDAAKWFLNDLLGDLMWNTPANQAWVRVLFSYEERPLEAERSPGGERQSTTDLLFRTTARAPFREEILKVLPEPQTDPAPYKYLLRYFPSLDEPNEVMPLMISAQATQEQREKLYQAIHRVVKGYPSRFYSEPFMVLVDSKKEDGILVDAH